MMLFTPRLLRGWGRHALLALVALAVGVALSAVLRSPATAQTPRPQAGGDTTIYSRTSRSYEQPAPNLDAYWAERHAVGDLAFEAAFVTAPAQVNPGLGPLFNGTACAGCHIKNGRGLPEKGQRAVRVSQVEPGIGHGSDYSFALEVDSPGGNTPAVPGIGTQLQEQGVHGHAPEGIVQLVWEDQLGTYPDGTEYQLRSPQITLLALDSSPFPEGIAISHRIPQPVFGAGLLEAVPEADIVQRADPGDRNGDGISGRPNRVWNVIEQRPTLGRFGWKANTPTLLQQSASAYINDMGVTNPLFPDADGAMDIAMDTLEAASVYVQTIAVPARTLLDDPQVQRGERLFAAANCIACHVSELRTGPHQIPALANQTIHPYTDLLLHDLGPALADGRPDFEATGREWRTPPLWGVGLTQTVLPFSGFLHDGRARTLEEAVLWHGGEAELARSTFQAMEQDDRAALIRFLRSL